MSYKLEKPYTEIQRADFIVEYNHNQNLKIEETNTVIYALEAYEKLENESVIDISDTEEYQLQTLSKEKEIKKKSLQSQIDAIDLKRIRALSEGGMMDDGTSYLDYYTN